MTSRILAASGVVLVPVIVAAAFLWAAALPAPTVSSEDTYSFERDMEGWTVGSADLFSGNCTGASQGNCTMAWSVERSTDLAAEGVVSVRMFLDNLQNQGRIWIERAFVVAPGRMYDVDVTFAFASADSATMNHWTILAGALPERPDSQNTMTLVCKGDTGTGAGSSSGYVWFDASRESTVRSDASGRIWVLVGVWGTGEGSRTYYLDAVRVSIGLS